MSELQDEHKEFLTIHEAADLLGIARATLYKKTMGRELPFYRIGKFVRFKRKELLEWIEARRVEPENEE